jgi:hypothetical protein
MPQLPAGATVPDTHFRKAGIGRWLLGAAIAVGGLILLRVASRALSSPGSEETVDDNAPARLRLQSSERRYPPFLDTAVSAITIEPSPDQAPNEQLAVIGIARKEFDKRLNKPNTLFAVARSDSAGIWQPAVAEPQLFYGVAGDMQGEVYAFGIPLEAGESRLITGSMYDGMFTPFKTTRLLALTNKDGLLYDYPNVPIVYFIH